jgi:hypothetical protein
MSMLGAERLFCYCQRALVELPRSAKVALLMHQQGEVVEARPRVRMLGTECLFGERQCALQERPRRYKVALVLEQTGEVVEGRRRTAMLGTERLFGDRQCALLQWRQTRRAVVGIAVVFPGGDFVDQDLFVGNTAIEALRR